MDRKLYQLDKSLPVVGTLAGNGAQDVGDDAVDVFDLAVGFMMVLIDELCTHCRVQARSVGTGEACVAVRDEHVGQPHVAEYLRDDVARPLLVLWPWQALLLLSKSTCVPAVHVGVSRQTICCWPACCTLSPSPRVAAGASAWTPSSCPSRAQATTFCSRAPADCR